MKDFQILFLTLLIFGFAPNVYSQCTPNTLAFNGSEPVYNSACGNTSYQTLNGTSPVGSGQTFRWEVSFAGSPYTTVVDESNIPISSPDLSKNDITNFILLPNGNSSGDYRIRRIVIDTSPACSDTSEPVFLYYSQSSASISGGTLSGTSTACAPASGSLMVTGHTGPVLQWESAPTSGGPWTVISNTTNTLEYTNLTESRCYRALIDNICDAGNIRRIDDMDKYSTTFCVTVNSIPIIEVHPANQGVCLGSPLTLSVTATSVLALTYQWRKNGIDITGATSSSYTISSVASTDAGSYDVVVSNSCGSIISDQAVVTVNPIPTVTVPADLSVCPGTTVSSSTFTTSPSDASYTWTNSNISIGLGESGSGPIPEFTATNSTSLPISAIITVTPMLNGCTGPTSQYTITVKPRATVTVPPPITVCAGETIPSSAFTSPLSGTVDYNWTNSDISIGLEASGTGNIRSFLATNSTSSPITSTITVTPTFNGCVGTPSPFTITVNPKPVILPTTSSTAETACGRADGSITVDATGSGLEYSIDDGNNFQPGNFFENLAAGSYSIVVKNFTGCITTSTLSVSSPFAPDRPEINTLEPICEGSSLNLSVKNPDPSLTYNWTGPNGFNDTRQEIALSNTEASMSGNYTVTASNGSCVSPATIFPVTIKPLPSVIVPEDIIVCSGTQIPVTSFTSTPNGAQFTWTNSDISIGLSARGDNNVDEFTALNLTTTPVTARITVTPTLNNCTGEPKVYTITVNPVPDVSVPEDLTFCHGEIIPKTVFTSSLAGTTYSWTVTGLGSTFSGTGNIPSFSALNSSELPITGSVSVTPISVSGCPGVTKSFTITIKPLPRVINTSLSQTICSGSPSIPVILTSNISGATLSWTASATPGISGFTPNGSDVIPSEAISMTGTSPGSITYTIMPLANGCSGPASTYIIYVSPLPVVTNVLLNQTICSGSKTTQVNLTSNVTGTTFSWTAVATAGISGFTATGSGAIPSETITGSNSGTITYTIIPSANGCSGPATSYKVNVNPLPTASINGDQSVCYGGTAYLEITLTGATPWSITYTDGTTPVTINGITDPQFLLPVTSTSTKVYEISTVTDNASCSNTGSGSATVTQPDIALSGTVTGSNVTCYGKDDGKIIITASGGYGNFQYSIDEGSTWHTTSTFTDIKPGTYNVQIRDRFCVIVVDESLLIVQPASPVAGTAVSTNITCTGADDGSITINSSGGYGNYEYSIDGGANWQSNHTFTGLSPGNYAIQLRDADQISCATVVNALITEPAALTLDGSHSPILCYGGSTTVTLVAGGGTGALEYRLGSGSYQASNTFTGVLAGSHQFWVRDINGCEQDYTVTISQPARLTLTATASPIQCDGTSTVTLLAQGGTGNYQFRNGSNAYQVANTFNLGQESYTFYVSDGACEESVVVNIAGQSSLTLTGSFTPITCFGGNSTVTLTANGGNGSYTYKADNGAWQTGNTFTLSSGDHIFAVRDAGGCQQFFQVNIPETEKLNVILTKLKDASCFGASTGSLSLSMTGNKGTVNITWFKDGQPISTPPDLNTLSAGSYLAQVTDACSSITSNEIIIQPSPLTVLLRKIKDADCTGTATGALDLQISGGEGTVIQTWTKDGAAISTPANLSALVAGTYRVTVQDNCSTVQSENIIIDPAALQIDFYKITDVSCKGNTDGGIGMRIFNSTGTTTVSWFKNNAPVSTPADLRQLTAGIYHVQVADFCSQVTTQQITITEPTILSAGILSKKDVSCFGGTDGSATPTISGGTAPYRYLWSNNSTNKDLTGVSTGTYTVTVTDLNNCSATQSVTITEPADLTLDGSHSPILCYGGSTTVTLIANGGTGALEYRLGTGSYQASNTFSGVLAGSHQFWVRDINGCEQDYTVTISQPAQLTLTATASPIQCDGTSTVTLLAQGGTGNYQFRNGSDAYQASNTFNLGQGSYTFYVTDGACEESVVVNIAGQSSLTLSGSFTPIACFGGNSTVTLTANGGNGSYTYKADNGVWQTGNTFALPSGDHIFTVRDAGGCMQFFQIKIPGTEQLNVVLVKLKDASCFGTSTGSLSLNMTGNKGTVNISWLKDGQPISTPSDLNALSAGSYSVQVTDACSSITSNEIIIQPSPLTVLLRKIKDADCTGTATGALDLQISGGEGAVIQTWSKDGAAISTPANLSALAAGTYRVTVQDNCSTVQSDNIIIDPAALQVDFYKITDVSCKGNSDGGIGMRIFNSTGTTTVSWFKDNAPVSTPVDLRQLTAGTYHVQVADYCSQVTSGKISITEPVALAAGTLIVKHTVCKTSNDGEITANITGGTKPYRFQWNGLSQTSSVISNLSPGLYELLVTDAEGCTVTASAEVLAGNCPPIAIDDRFTTDEEVVISGSVAINDFDRQNESLTFSMTSAVKNGRIVFTDDGKFTYTPNPGFWATETFTYQVCNTSGLCAEATAYISVIPYTVVSLTPAILNVREGKKTAITAKLMRPFKDDVIITISYSGNAIKEKDYVLLDQFQQIRIPKGQVTTTEKITLAALTDDLQEGDEDVILQISETSDPLVRIGTGSVVIISDIYPSDSLPATPVSKEIPANPDITPDPLVSPNNDGQGNEFFKIENIVSFPDNEVVIFNRWGNEIFRVRGYNESDRVFSGIANTGLVTNTNSPLPDGVYYYLITTKRIVNGQSIVALNKGYLILKR